MNLFMVQIWSAYFMCWALKLEQAVSNDRVWSFDFNESIFANIQDFGSIERFNVCDWRVLNYSVCLIKYILFA